MNKKENRTTADRLDFNFARERSLNLLKSSSHKENKIGLFILMGIYTGLRVSELLSLKYKNVQDDKLIINPLKKKGKYQPRIIPIHPFIRTYLNGNSDEYIFLNSQGTVYTKNSMIRLMKQAFYDIVNEKNISCHTTRKTFGYHFWEVEDFSEKSLAKLCDAFSHRSISTTKKYLGITQDDLDDVYLKF